MAISFVQRPEDVIEVKKLTRGRALVMAKIEKPQAITRLDEVIDVSDALMVARGDLGVEMPLEKVPGLQKRINRSARRMGRPVVVATQMLELMIRRRSRRARKSRTSRPRCSKARTRSCFRPKAPPGNIHSTRWRR